MTFQLSAYKAKSVAFTGAGRNWQRQYLDLYITGATTDVSLDIASDTAGSLGTFWTAVTADATYGTLANNALTCVQSIVAVCKQLEAVTSEPLLARSMLGGGGFLFFTSAAISSGTSVSATVTGLLATDTVVAVTQKAANSNDLTPAGFGTPTANILPLTYGAASGTGGTVEVLVYRASGATVSPGQYSLAITGHLPTITFGASDAPTTNILTLEWTLQDGVFGVNQDAGAAF